MQSEIHTPTPQLEAQPGSSSNPNNSTEATILNIVKKYSILKDVFFYIAFSILLAGMSAFASPGTEGIGGDILLFISSIVNLTLFAIFIGTSNTVFKNVTKSLKGYRIGIFAQQADIQVLPKKDVVKSVRFFTIPYILMTCIMLVTWFNRALANIGLTFVVSIDDYISAGFLLPLLFQILSLIWIPYTMFRVVIWMNAMFQKSNLKFAEKKGDVSFDRNPETFIQPSKTSLVILAVYLLVWGGCNLFFYFAS